MKVTPSAYTVYLSEKRCVTSFKASARFSQNFKISLSPGFRNVYPLRVPRTFPLRFPLTGFAQKFPSGFRRVLFRIFSGFLSRCMLGFPRTFLSEVEQKFLSGFSTRFPTPYKTREFKPVAMMTPPRTTSIKNDFILFYLRLSPYSKVIYFVYHCQNYHRTESGIQRQI